MGSIGAAIIAKESVEKRGETNFKGLNLAESTFHSESFECSSCTNRCEVVKIKENNIDIGCFGDRCGKWNRIKDVSKNP